MYTFWLIPDQRWNVRYLSVSNISNNGRGAINHFPAEDFCTVPASESFRELSSRGLVGQKCSYRHASSTWEAEAQKVWIPAQNKKHRKHKFKQSVALHQVIKWEALFLGAEKGFISVSSMSFCREWFEYYSCAWMTNTPISHLLQTMESNRERNRLHFFLRYVYTYL